MNSNYDWIVIAGGFRSMVAAYALAQRGERVLLAEPGGKLGGFMSPIRWRDFWIDKGPQFFDNFEEADRAFFDAMVGENLLESIGFSYASYMNGHKTDGFAIPDWRGRGADFTARAFAELLSERLCDAPGDAPATMDGVIARDGGAAMGGALRDMARKFLRNDPVAMGLPACQMVTFLGRKLLFDQEASVDLKKSPMLDALLAAQKKSVGETRYNLYPRGTSLETVRCAMERALARVGVDVLLDAPLVALDTSAKTCRFDAGEAGYGQVFFGGDVRDSERALLGSRTLAAQTHPLPEIFHCFAVPADQVDEAYYLIDYDSDHLSSRMTNFCNYMDARDDAGNGVVCIEQPVDKGSADWTDPARNQARIFAEAQETGNIRAKGYCAAHSFAIPVTYKVPMAGFVSAWEDMKTRVAAQCGSDVVLPDATLLTRKQTMDDLRVLGIL